MVAGGPAIRVQQGSSNQKDGRPCRASEELSRWPRAELQVKSEGTAPSESGSPVPISWLLGFSQQYALISANFENMNTKDPKGQNRSEKEIQIPHY